MIWIHLVTVLALAQYLVFAILVGRARGKYGVKAPATVGHPMFERLYRVQTNTLELMVVFIPALWLAAHYCSPSWMAAVGAIYLIGRLIYLRAYTQEPASRALGYLLSFTPVVVLLIGACTGMVLTSLR